MRILAGGRCAGHDRALAVAIAVSAVSAFAASGEPASPGDGFRWSDEDPASLALWEGGKPVWVYNHGVMSRKGVSPSYNRSGYLHPLYGLDGEVLTEDFAKDHLHHRGVFWAWPHIAIGGKEYQTWVPTEPLRVRHARFVRKEAGVSSAALAVENDWILGAERVVREEVAIRVMPADATGRLIDFELAWTALEKPVALRGAEGKSYGGFTIRYNTRPNEPGRIAEKDVAITVPDGLSKKDLTETRLPWADLSAPFPGAPGPSGAAIFIHPSHPDHPPTWLTRHYGCLCVGWPGVKGGTLEPGKTARCRYRVWVHRGVPDVAALKAVFEAYAALP